MSFQVGPSCDGCSACVAACPQGAIRPGRPGETPYVVVSLDCNDCAKCAIVCPRTALAPDPAWAQCRGRGCPLTSNRLAGWACTEGWARCPHCGGALWKAPGDTEWVCARCDTSSRVICPKVRRTAGVRLTSAVTAATAMTGDAPADPSPTRSPRPATGTVRTHAAVR